MPSHASQHTLIVATGPCVVRVDSVGVQAQSPALGLASRREQYVHGVQQQNPTTMTVLSTSYISS